MGFNTELIIRSILLGVGLAMDAFSVSLADGLSEHDMKISRKLAIAGTFAVFQFAMPMIGWVVVRTAVEAFGVLETFIPWIALILLLYIGIKMLVEGIRDRRNERASAEISGEAAVEADPVNTADPGHRLGFAALMLQGVATSIDALSVGFTIEEYTFPAALAASLIIGAVTFAICAAGIDIGKKAGTFLTGRASMLGGIILIFMGLEIWAKGILF